jgi:hypothetical protein
MRASSPDLIFASRGGTLPRIAVTSTSARSARNWAIRRAGVSAPGQARRRRWHAL